MKLISKIAIIAGGIVSVPLIAALFTKKKYAVERDVTINRSRQEVFDYIKYLKNQDHYSKWATLDPLMEKTYHGTDGTIGFVSAWSSKRDDVGIGEQEIVNIIEGERIDCELRFKKPFESTSPAYMSVESEMGNQTKVKWGFSGQMNYPMNLMLLFMDFEKMVGDDFEEGLRKLKIQLEK